MKNKKRLLYLICLIFFISFEKTLGDQFNFEAKEIQTQNNGNLINAKNGIKITTDNGIKILADNFIYNKDNETLFIKGNVEINDYKNDLKIFGQQFTYNRNEKEIFTDQNVKFIYKDRYSLDAKELNYSIDDKKITSDKNILLVDDLNNSIKSDNLYFLISDDIIKLKNLIYTDAIGNKHTINQAIINTYNNELIGKDLEINFDKKTFGNNKNDPRLKGNAIFSTKNKTKITKGVFTTCKKNDTCPPWAISAKEIVHDKTKKTINYKNAVLKLYDKPVFYFPKFFHPDPTVKRQSGFLIPSFADNSNTGLHLSIPYFKVISGSKDFTFKPRFYSDETMLINTEFRSVSKNSKKIADVSFKNNKSGSKNGNSEKHIFYNLKTVNLNNSLFEDSEVEFNLQKVSNDRYLKIYDIDSPLITSTSTMHSYVDFNGMNEDSNFKVSAEIFEDTTKDYSDRYEYILPSVEIDKIINLKKELNGVLSLNTTGLIKQYQTNITEKSVINNLNYESYSIFANNGVVSDYSLILKNVNRDSKNSNTYKNRKELEFLSAGMFTLSYPLKKIEENFKKFFTPKMSFRYSPNNTNNMSLDDNRIDVNNVFSLGRLSSNDNVESGASITVGSDYLIKDSADSDILKLGLATVLRDKENKDLPIKSTLDQKSSNIFGNIEFKPSKFFNIEYDFSLDNDFERSTYDHIKTELYINNFVNSFEFLEETGPLGNQGYWNNKSTFNFSSQNSISFNKRRNTKTNLTEFYNLIYQYENDCLTAAIEYNKNFYNDQELKPAEELFFSLTIVPFTKVNSTNMNK